MVVGRPAVGVAWVLWIVRARGLGPLSVKRLAKTDGLKSGECQSLIERF